MELCKIDRRTVPFACVRPYLSIEQEYRRLKLQQPFQVLQGHSLYSEAKNPHCELASRSWDPVNSPADYGLIDRPEF